MNPQRFRLLLLQALVAVLLVGFWHVGATVPVGGGYLLPKFFFSTPADVGLRVWKLFAEGTAQIAELKKRSHDLAADLTETYDVTFDRIKKFGPLPNVD